MKFYRNDMIALVAAGVVMAVVAIALPYGGALVRGLVGLVTAVLVYVAYLVLRKPDELLELEESLQSIANNAETIARITHRSEASSVREKLNDIAVYTARIAAKCFKRDLVTIGVHIRRLERLTSNFITVLGVLVGEVILDRREMADAIRSIKTEKIPAMMESLGDLEVAIDEIAARRWQAAESELETLNRLADLQSKAGQAAQMLKRIIKDSPRN